MTEANQPVTLDPTSNDVAYRTYLKPATIDLDPATAGQQTSVVRAGGTFALQAAGTVLFTPVAGFAGRATTQYVVRDAAGRWSNPAELAVTVKPDPTAAIPIATFETGVEGWGPGNWIPDAGVVTQTADFHPEGSFGLHLDVSTAHWFGVTFGQPLDLSSKSQIAYELRTGASGTSVSLALQTGAGYTWCQSSFPWIQPETTTTITVDLLTDFSCGSEVLGDVRGLLIFLSPGSYDIDNVRGL